jgi:KTSC domain
MITNIPVSSSLIAQAAYDDEAQELTIVFKSNGAKWHYSGVSQDEADSFAGAGSAGQYFLQNIKGQHPERRG